MGDNMITIAICDKDKTFVGNFEKLLEAACTMLSLSFTIEAYYSGEELINDLQVKRIQYDLIFMAVEMELISGIIAGQIIREKLHDYTTEIIYLSDYATYYPDILSLKPFGLLPKPIGMEKLHSTMKKFMRHYNHLHDRLVVRNKNTHHVIRKGEIIFLESAKRNVILTKKDAYSGHIDVTEFVSTMERMVAEFQNDIYFIRIHLSYIINMHFITSLMPDEVELDNKYRIPISRTYNEAAAVLRKYTEGIR